MVPSYLGLTKYLGISISRSLNFGCHVNNIVEKATSVWGMLYLIINKYSPIPTRTHINILKLYINPILIYSGAVWAPYLSNTQWRKIEVVQTIATRTILSIPTYVNNQVSPSTDSLTTVKSNNKKQSIILFNKYEKSIYSHIRELGHIEYPIQ